MMKIVMMLMFVIIIISILFSVYMQDGTVNYFDLSWNHIILMKLCVNDVHMMYI